MLFGFSGMMGLFSASQSGMPLSINLKLKGAVPPNMVTRVTMLPDGVVREIRRADPEYWAVLVKAYSKSVDDGKPLGVAGVASLVDGFSLSASFY
jgi:hypothetical protein